MFPHKEVFEKSSNVDRPLATFTIDVRDSLKPLRPIGISEQHLAREIVTYGHRMIETVPHAKFDNLLTADYTEIEALRSIANLFRKYLDDVSIEKPLSIAVFDPPGSGKSFAIKAIATSLGVNRLKAIEFNVAEWQTPDDLTDALHVARDIRLNGAVPLVFFDEFDSGLKESPLAWLKAFLAPMQDGRFKEKSRQHEVGRAIFVFAGGTAETFSNFERYSDTKASPKRGEPKPTASKNIRRSRATTYSTEFQALKGPDFISRLSGYVDIRGLNRTARRSSKGHILRRAIILRTHLEKYKSLFDGDGELKIDMGVLNAFIMVDKFNHGARSLEAIVRMSSLSNDTYHFARSTLPSDEQLMLHVDPKSFLHDA
jgi:ATPase family associated with various cellular activities (AAA)